jgi:hypothetical protein
VEELRGHGVVFEEYDLPGFKTVNGIAEIAGEKSAGSRTVRAICWPSENRWAEAPKVL